MLFTITKCNLNLEILSHPSQSEKKNEGQQMMPRMRGGGGVRNTYNKIYHLTLVFHFIKQQIK